MAGGPVHSYEIYVRCSPHDVWGALTDPSLTPRYFMGLTIVSDWTAGSTIRQARRDGATWNEGTVLEVDPPRRLVTSFRSLAEEARDDPASRVTWTIEPVGEVTLVKLLHDGFADRSTTYEMVRSGWSVVLSALKTLLETGKPLRVPAPALFENEERPRSRRTSEQLAAMEIAGFTIQLHVADGAAARRWYERLLGREPDFRPFGDDSFVEWRFTPGYSELHVVESERPGSLEGRLRLGVADIDATHASLLAAGIEVSGIEDLPNVVRWCDFEDPWRNRLGLYLDLVRFPPG